MRVTPTPPACFAQPDLKPFERGNWPAQWVRPDFGSTPPPSSYVWACRLRFDLDARAALRVHVSADQRYELFLDGRRIGLGPERGDAHHWFYETFDLELDPGPHTFVARVAWLDIDSYVAPGAQIAVRPGFLLAAEPPFTDRLSTGIAAWQAKLLAGWSFTPPRGDNAGHFAGGHVQIDGRLYDWDHPRGEGEGWAAVVQSELARDRINRFGELRTRLLRPAMLPPQLDAVGRVGRVVHVDEPAEDGAAAAVDPAARRADELDAWQAAWSGQRPLAIPPHTRRRVLIDLDDYYCARLCPTLSGGRDAVVSVAWAESLFEQPTGNVKGHRDRIDGKHFRGRTDRYIADGGSGRAFEPLWWNAGRFVQIVVTTADQPLTIDSFTLRETRYPLQKQTTLDLDEPRFNAAVPIMWRTLQVCAHETYFDCPYYEQLQYAGDTRLQVLVTYLNTADDALPRKALTLFHASLSDLGLTEARYPCNNRQIIPQFALYWVAMLHDFALWRGRRDVVRPLMPAARCVLDTFLTRVGDDGLVRWPDGWNWVDWVPGWRSGVPPLDDGSPDISGINQWQLIYVLGLAAELERWLDEPALADRLDQRRRMLADAATRAFFDDSRGLFADTASRRCHSEHVQCFALLSGLLDDATRRRVLDGLLSAGDLARATIYFQHYLFEVLADAGRTDQLLDRMTLWYDLPRLGLRTTLEKPEPSRSDCHAWGAHPLYHAVASIMGIRPAGLGSDELIIRPQLAGLRHARGSVMTSRGLVTAAFERHDGRLDADIDLPPGQHATLIAAGLTHRLAPGRTRHRLPVGNTSATQ